MDTARELLHLTPVYQEVEGGWVQATLAELPGVITAARSRAEAEEMLLDALREFFLSFGPESPNEASTVAEGSLTLTVSVGR